jgi:hypothetical protein
MLTIGCANAARGHTPRMSREHPTDVERFVAAQMRSLLLSATIHITHDREHLSWLEPLLADTNADIDDLFRFGQMDAATLWDTYHRMRIGWATLERHWVGVAAGSVAAQLPEW